MHIFSILEKHQIHHSINTNEACTSLKLCNNLTLKPFFIFCDLPYLSYSRSKLQLKSKLDQKILKLIKIDL